MGYQGKGPIRISGKLYDSTNQIGSGSSVLISTGVGVSWTNSSNLSGIVTSIVAGTGVTISGSTGRVTINSNIISVGTGITLGTPTDTSLSDGLLSFTPTTTVTDAIDEVNEVLNRLAPAKPPNLSTISLSLSSTTYSATETSTGVVRSSSVTSNTLAQTGITTFFYDGDSGTLSAEIDGVVPTGSSRILTTGNDMGTYGVLGIMTDTGFPVSGNGANFWKALTARIVPTAGLYPSGLSVGIHTYQLKHTSTGNTPLLNFYVDDPGTVTISGISTSYVGSATTYISGVPTLQSGTTFTSTFTVNNAVRQFYNTTRIAGVAATMLSATVNSIITGVQVNGAGITTTLTLTVGSSKYAESNSLTITGHNSANTAGTPSIFDLGARVDTNSSLTESNRKISGVGTAPSTGYGGSWDSTTSLVTLSEELQLLNNKFQYPPSVNYSSNKPVAGPNYSVGMGTSDRWVTFQPLTASNASNINITFNGATNFGSTAIVSGLSLFVKVEGVTGWIDGNAAYSPGTNPSTNGFPALVISSSTATTKVVTFGTITRSGTVYVRIGLPSGSNKSFTDITVTQS